MNIHDRLASVLGTDIAALALSCGMVACFSSNAQEVRLRFAETKDLKEFQTCHALQRIPLFNGTDRLGYVAFLPCRVPQTDKHDLVLDERYTPDDLMYILKQHGYTDIQTAVSDTTNGNIMITCRNGRNVPSRFILD